jgi:hypothetical protein
MYRTDATAASDATTFYGLCRAAAMLFSALFSAPGRVATAAADQASRPPVRICTIRRAALPLFAALSLAACSADFEREHPAISAAPPSDLRADQARLFFYRPNDSLFPAIRPAVIINGRKVGTSVVGEGFYRDARPGRYVIFLASDDDDRLTFTLAPGEVRYVRTSLSMSWLGPRLSPESVTADQGERELQSVVLVEPRLEN